MNIKGNKYTYVIAALILLVLVIVVVKIAGISSDKKKAANTADGIKYVKGLEKQDVAEVSNIKEERRKAAIRAELEQKKAELLSDDTDVWSLFEDYAFIGDSRCVGFEYYKFLAPERVFAKAGWTINNVEEQIPELKALNPSCVFLCFGVNEVIGNWMTGEAYADGMKEVILKLREALPNATIYVNSAIPATDIAFAKNSRFRNIPEYNAALKKMCNEMGVPYIDNDSIAAEHKDLYEGDGIHLKSPFYKYWGKNIMGVYYDVNAGLYEFATATDASTDE